MVKSGNLNNFSPQESRPWTPRFCVFFFPLETNLFTLFSEHSVIANPQPGVEKPQLASRHSTQLTSLLCGLITEVLGYLF